jgi:hydrogenase expression/formation protein HypC
MCLGVPGRVLQIDGMDATVDFFGVRKKVRLDIVDVPVGVGDYVLNHVGFAIRRIPEAEVDDTLALFDAILNGTIEGDLMADDVRGEIDAAGPRVDDPPNEIRAGDTPASCPVFIPTQQAKEKEHG